MQCGGAWSAYDDRNRVECLASHPCQAQADDDMSSSYAPIPGLQGLQDAGVYVYVGGGDVDGGEYCLNMG